MSFEERLAAARQEQIHERSREETELARQAAARKEQARQAALPLVPEVYEAIDALRRRRNESREFLMEKRDTRGGGVHALRVEVPKTRHGLFRLQADEAGLAFNGWRVSCPGSGARVFELLVPLEGEPSAGLSPENKQPGLEKSLEEFADAGYFEYWAWVTESESERRHATAAEGLAKFSRLIMAHLLELP